MGAKNQSLSLKVFMTEVVKICERASKEEITAYVLSSAKALHFSERNKFLSNLKKHFNKKSKTYTNDSEILKKILADIENLRTELKKREEAIEKRDFEDFYDELDYRSRYDNYGDGYDYGCDWLPDVATEEHVDAVINYFSETAEFFLTGRLETALKIYKKLFELLDEIDEFHSQLLDHSEFNIKEEKARFGRCALECAPKDRKSAELAAAIDAHVFQAEEVIEINQSRYPMLRDVMESLTGSNDIWDTFLPEWQKYLWNTKNVRGNLLLMEVTKMLDGVAGVAQLATSWGVDQPNGFVYWAECCKDSGDWKQVREICLNAFKLLPYGPVRSKLADYLAEAGIKLKLPDIILNGLREKFFSTGLAENMLQWLDEAVTQKKDSTELEKAIAFLEKQDHKSEHINKLHAVGLLAAGRLDDAMKLPKSDETIGWSSGISGLIHSALQALMLKDFSNAKTIKSQLKQYTSFYLWHYDLDDCSGNDVNFYDHVVNGLSKIHLPDERIDEFKTRVKNTARNRIDYIVKSKHRKAYRRAAETLCSYAEYLALTGTFSDAVPWIHEFYFNKYSRFRAFREEVVAVINDSKILKKIKLK